MGGAAVCLADGKDPAGVMPGGRSAILRTWRPMRLHGGPAGAELLGDLVRRGPAQHVLQPHDYQQIVLQLTGHARAVAADVQRHAQQLSADNPRRAHADVVLEEAEQRLAVPLEGTAACAQNRARVVRDLYSRLDRLTEASPAAHA